MYASISPVAPSTVVPTNDELDRIEQTFDCRLPADYRAFVTTIGLGNLNGYLEILSPERVVAETKMMRAIYKEEDIEAPYHLFFFDCFDNATAFFQATDIDRFICIASSNIGDCHYILPGDPTRYFEAPRDGFEIAIAGTTMEEWLEYLDPRTRYRPQARRVVDEGVVREDDGQPDGTAYLHTFTPEGYPPPDPRPWDEVEITWGHADDALVTYSRSHGYDRLPDPTIDLIHNYMARYPLFALLDAIAQHDHRTRFKMQAQDVPEAQLEVPRYEATLRAAGGQHGLTLYVHVLTEYSSGLFNWLVRTINALEAESPPGLLALISK